jgi:hypothetical protein
MLVQIAGQSCLYMAQFRCHVLTVAMCYQLCVCVTRVLAPWRAWLFETFFFFFHCSIFDCELADLMMSAEGSTSQLPRRLSRGGGDQQMVADCSSSDLPALWADVY